MATPFRLKRSAVTGKRPGLADLEKGELAINFYDGNLYAERDTGGVGIGTTIANLTPWKEQFSRNEVFYSGIVSATTYHGDQIIGTPTGGSFRAGAYTPVITEKTKDSIDELNYILGKLVPAAPDNIGGASLVLSGVGVGRLCAGFTPTNNTAGDLSVSAGTQYSRNIDSTITTDYLSDYGPGDSGTITGLVNATSIGSTALNISFGLYAVKSDNGTYGSLQIADEKDAADSTRNVGITSLFYEVLDMRLINAASPDGFNKAQITHGSNSTSKVYWYEDPSTVSAPVISFGAVQPPASPNIVHSSYVPHYDYNAANTFKYVLTVTNASGDMYIQNKLLNSDGQGNAFVNSGHKNYTDFAAGTNPPTRNYGVGTGVTCMISTYPRNNMHSTITSNHFGRYDANTPYGSHNNRRISYSPAVNIMSGSTSNVDEDNISSTVGGGTNGTRTNAANGDNPNPIYSTWAGNASGTPNGWEAIVRGGILRHDLTNYSTGYMPASGPNLSGRNSSDSQYFQVQLTESAVSTFNITYTGSCAGCWVCMPQNSTWTTGLSNTNGWADMFNEYIGSGVPRNVDPGCAYGGVMDNNGGTFTCTFGTESSSNDSANRILIRFKLTSGQSISGLSFTST